MSSIVDEPRAFRRMDWTAAALLARLRPALPLIAVTIAAIVLRLLIVPATDVSWLITLSEKVLDGTRLYVDLIEVNPPASVLLYLPAVALARLIGIAPEIVVNTLVFLAVGASLWITSRILMRARLLDGVDGWTLAAFAAFLLLVFPARTFAQREHIAVIVLLPALATYVVRARGISPGLAAAVIAGIGTGIALSIKPHFALAVILAAAIAAYHAKSWRTLFVSEHWIAGSIVAIYGASIFVFYPQFISDVLPLVQTVYVPARLPWLTILTRTPVNFWLLSIFLLARQQRGAIFQPRFSILLTASCGFALAYAVQGKGWPYHTYPMLALALLALAVLANAREGTAPEAAATRHSEMDRLALLAITAGLVGASVYWLTMYGFGLTYAAEGKGWPYHAFPMFVLALLVLASLASARQGMAPAAAKKHSRMDRLILLAMTAGFVGASFYWLTIAVDYTPLAETIRRNAIAPKILAISPDIGLGHPLVRQVGGAWAQRVGSLWITDKAEWLLKTKKSPAVAARIADYAARDRAMLLEDIGREKPDIILLDADWEARTRSDPALSALLRAYSEIGREQGIIILGRQSREKPRQGPIGSN
jgi:hypothetical protein